MSIRSYLDLRSPMLWITDFKDREAQSCNTSPIFLAFSHALSPICLATVFLAYAFYALPDVVTRYPTGTNPSAQKVVLPARWARSSGLIGQRNVT
jgi:hypothetical protein